MTDNRDLNVEVQGDDIVVTLPGTSYVVTYYRAAAFPQQLLTKSHSGREEQRAPMTASRVLLSRLARSQRQGVRARVDRVGGGARLPNAL